MILQVNTFSVLTKTYIHFVSKQTRTSILLFEVKWSRRSQCWCVGSREEGTGLLLSWPLFVMLCNIGIAFYRPVFFEVLCLSQIARMRITSFKSITYSLHHQLQQRTRCIHLSIHELKGDPNKSAYTTCPGYDLLVWWILPCMGTLMRWETHTLKPKFPRWQRWSLVPGETRRSAIAII